MSIIRRAPPEIVRVFEQLEAWGDALTAVEKQQQIIQLCPAPSYIHHLQES